jgi:tripartite-type tricarboxylate transporter receptor subunit TctC
MMRSGTPKAIVDRVSGALDKAMQSPDTGEKIAAAGLEVDYRNAAGMSDHLKVLRERYADIIKKNNIRIEHP